MGKPILAIVAAVLVACTGCAGLLKSLGRDRTEIVRPTPDNPIMETVALWEAGEGRGLDNLPTRGFAGQLMFFTYRHPTPAVVDGKVTVYVFDDQGAPDEQSRPFWQHTFTGPEWNALARQTNLGTAYQLFVPYTRKGQHEARCSLRIKFEPSDGSPPVYSKMANVVLPGEKRDLPPATLTRKRIEPQRFDPEGATAMQSEAEAPAATQLRTNTVSLPSRHNISARTAARLQQLAEDMVREQERQGGVQQASHTEAVNADPDGVELTSGSGRYQLHR